MDLAAQADFLIRKAAAQLEELEKRRELLIEAARRVAAALREEFGVTQVWMFGSVLRPWFHEGSDLDLAVEGMSPARLGEAWDRACEIVRGPVDLVAIEEAPEPLRRRINETGRIVE